MIRRRNSKNNDARSKKAISAALSIRDGAFVRSTGVDAEGYLNPNVYVNLATDTAVSLANGINVKTRGDRKIIVEVKATVTYEDETGPFSSQRTVYVDAKKCVRLKKGWLRNGTLHVEVYGDGTLQASYRPLAQSAHGLVGDFGAHLLHNVYKVASIEDIAFMASVKVRGDDDWLITESGDLYYCNEATLLKAFGQIEAKVMPLGRLVL